MENTTTMADQSVRNTLSIMAWGMSALCAWVVVLAVHNFQFHSAAVPYSNYKETPSVIVSTPTFETNP